MLAGGFDLLALDHFHNTEWCAGDKKISSTDRESADIDRMKPVNIFMWGDSLDYFFFGNMFWQGKLTQNRMSLAVVIELFDQL